MTDRLTILCGDALEQLRTLPDESVQTCVTSPPYWGLRDYGVAGQIGLEPCVEIWIGRLVEVFREVRRVLRDDGTLWLNIGDCYGSGTAKRRHPTQTGKHGYWENPAICLRNGAPAKQLLGLPWRVAFALQADGWWLRCDIVCYKPNPMPESVTDRPTRAHEFVFLLSKSQRYYYDAEAIKEPWSCDRDDMREKGVRTGSAYLQQGQNGYSNSVKPDKQRGHSRRHAGFNDRWDKMSKEEQQQNGRNKRSVWTIATTPYPEAHFATYPADLVKPCILAGSRAGDVVLDPFAGSGTTGQVALELGRKAVLIELNPEYVNLIERRCDVTPGLAL